MRASIPVVDLFAGPGGLGEGFSALRDPRGRSVFHLALSVEKDEAAHRTLRLRAFFRSFGGNVPDAYYHYLRGDLGELELSDRFPTNWSQADAEAWRFTLAPHNHSEVSGRVRRAIAGSDVWVLVGGPPCQAYSIAGRSRMRPVDRKGFERDERHFLYREYLRLIVDHHPPVFVMENVKGLLTSRIGGRAMIGRILEDLSSPSHDGPRYRITPIGIGGAAYPENHDAYVLKSELHGVPQARHRVILVGIREDLPGCIEPLRLRARKNLEDALLGLPSIRSRLSREPDSFSNWLGALKEGSRLASAPHSGIQRKITSVMKQAARDAALHDVTGGSFMRYSNLKHSQSSDPLDLGRWYFDPRLSGVSCHESRRHMRSDLHRYLFAAAFAEVWDDSPDLRDFPRWLLPEHRNAEEGVEKGTFDDRFHVQLYGHPSTTVMSHISKDGHYYIHPDPSQCRSLTAREAARLQTFPDNYHFEGTRTQQYHQIGNAVPPLLAYQIAERVKEFLDDAVISAKSIRRGDMAQDTRRAASPL